MEHKSHVVVARHNEHLGWLFDILRNHKEFSATVYNDGMDVLVPRDIESHISFVLGDKIPSEPTKYIKWIISNWDRLDSYDKIVFLQGDPVYHNPTLVECFKYADQWNRNFQTLSLIAHPHPWPAARLILEGNIPHITYFAENAKVWHDEMKDDMHGVHFDDPFWHSFSKSAPGVTINYFSTLFGFKKPDVMKKCIAACFSTSTKTIQQVPYEAWQRLHDFVVSGCPKTSHLTSKSRAVFLEYLWSVIFEGTW